jgi:hypothetical protein
MEDAHTEEYNGYLIHIKYDDEPINPRTEWDNFATITCWHSRCNLGDKNISRDKVEDWLESLAAEALPNGEDQLRARLDKIWEDTRDPLVPQHRDLDDFNAHDRRYQSLKHKLIERLIFRAYPVFQPLYLYEHSGMTISTGPFGDPWDSGHVGVITISREKLLKEYGRKHITKKLLKTARSIVEAEVSEYDDVMTRNVYGYVIDCPEDENGNRAEHEDSSWGFVGDYKYCLEEAKRTVDYLVKEASVKKYADLTPAQQMAAI